MRIRVLFVRYEDDEQPRAVAVVDELTEDDWGGDVPETYRMERDGTDGEGREAFIDIPDASVLALFAMPTLPSSTPYTKGLEPADPTEGGAER